MELGMIGLGRMGAAMVRRLLRAGHRCVVADVRREAVEDLQKAGAAGAFSLEELVRQLAAPRMVWMMLPAAVVDGTLEKLVPLLQAGDTVIDGGNSSHRDDLRRAAQLRQRGLHYVDVGVSGGVWGVERGYCLMVGGERESVLRLEPVFTTLAPGVQAAPRTPGREGPPTPAEQGWLHCGPNGAGHFVKMVHNGIEYGLMAAYAEGLNILCHADAGLRPHATDAETAPLRNPEEYRYTFDLPEVTELWRRGSVIGSWLLDLTAEVLRQSPELKEYTGHVADSGEGRWTLAAAIDEGVPAPVLGSALYQRFSSRGASDFADRVLSAMRLQFGGHVEKKGGG
ncbi:phosphogluconate dehydrogenase (NAD(+)-dependent, decarboxylating) [Vitiosangium sp. GDMCC 1.1324]|uniref:phosphogluconate dehydrogenase (NAD(+)-dependent, decarboxylating) n=1 Tax=Vitiosangium sp. (strain GDMCC 1.1324) TaxID=2138576 RepID=UPI000D371FA7|nr:decarboxylating 6-phosphogluconate dehydrogenase [Vitiosangium sp. GDMCC 1.1324]PTL84763.1 6-phosphogluconate dehydrogenase (decarboxylating) [Vitiosangium sp. GDMCC 1.1324]